MISYHIHIHPTSIILISIYCDYRDKVVADDAMVIQVRSTGNSIIIHSIRAYPDRN